MKAVGHFGTQPRRVSGLAAVRLLLGGPLQQFGWAFFAFGSIFTWLFVPAADLASSWQFRGALSQAQARVTSCEKTGFSVGGSRGRQGTPIYANAYSFFGGEGVSYATGTCLDPGTTTLVEYARDTPSISRIVGMRTRPFGPAVLFVLIFPLVGAGLAAGGIRGGVARYQVVRDGRPATGKLVDQRTTNMRVNNRTVMALTFEFKAEDGTVHRATVRTADTAALEDDERENMLYDPRQPAKAVMLDALPSSIVTNETGDIDITQPVEAILVTVLPLIAIAINLAGSQLVV